MQVTGQEHCLDSGDTVGFHGTDVTHTCKTKHAVAGAQQVGEVVDSCAVWGVVTVLIQTDPSSQGNVTRIGACVTNQPMEGENKIIKDMFNTKDGKNRVSCSQLDGHSGRLAQPTPVLWHPLSSRGNGTRRNRHFHSSSETC